MKRPILLAGLLLLTLSLSARNDLHREIRRIVQNKQAVVGVAVQFADGQRFTMHNNRCYPLMSVFKFHVAVAALQRMEREDIAPDSIITVDSTWLRFGTYSPLRDRNPGRNVRISLAELINYTLSLSDNCTCDRLIAFAGGIEAVERCARNLRIGRCHLSETGASMHDDIRLCYANRCTPRSMIRMLQAVYSGKALSSKSLELLERAMLATSTGADKLRAGLPPETRLGHKTGHSDRTEEGLQIATNDAGIVYLPDGRRYYIAVFIRDSKEDDATNASIIAAISKAVYNTVCRAYPTHSAAAIP